MFFAMFVVALTMFLKLRMCLRVGVRMRRVRLRLLSLHMRFLACGLLARFGFSLVRARVVGMATRLVLSCWRRNAMLQLYGHVRTCGHASSVDVAFARTNIVLAFLLPCVRAGRVRQTISLRRGSTPLRGFVWLRVHRCSSCTDRMRLRLVDHMEALQHG